MIPVQQRLPSSTSRGSDFPLIPLAGPTATSQCSTMSTLPGEDCQRSRLSEDCGGGGSELAKITFLFCQQESMIKAIGLAIRMYKTLNIQYSKFSINSLNLTSAVLCTSIQKNAPLDSISYIPNGRPYDCNSRVQY